MKNKDRILAAMRIAEGKKPRLDKREPDATEGPGDKTTARDLLVKLDKDLDDLQYRLYAEAKTGLLVVFQAMDTAGKDGVIRRVFGPLNPQGVAVTPFKRPSIREMSHDYLWRVHPFVPAKGDIRIFNRSHYEDVLVYKVHKLISSKVLEQRYRQLNDFERYLAENNVRILKFFLHITKDEQKRRLEERLEIPEKRWKFEMGDLAERKLWDQYQDAYEETITRTSHKHAPWFVIPANHKWYRDWAVAEIIRRELKDINPQFPKEQEGLDGITVE